MKIALLSDLHIDHYSSQVNGLLQHFAETKIETGDVCVLAGDIGDGRFPDQYRTLFIGLGQWFDNIIIVTGNHDYYKSSLEQTHHSIALAMERAEAFYGRPIVHHLNRSSVEIGGHKFHGHAMWYRDQPGNASYEHWMNDIHFIQGLKSWVYEENGYWESYVADNVKKGDIVITHHLPSMKSVPSLYKTSETNRFFVCDMELEIKKAKPALWMHGHTHAGCDYKLGQTRVVCNPRGYPRERLQGPKGYQPLYIEVG